MKKRCSSCTVDFDCHSNGACWCGEITLSAEQLRSIEERFDNCLCPQCLISMARGGGASVEKKNFERKK